MEIENTNQAMVKLEQAIARNVASAAGVVERVMAQVPVDSVVRAEALGFRFEQAVQGASDDNQMVRVAPRPAVLEMAAGDKTWGLHRHALGQIASKANVPQAYVDHLLDGDAWQGEMLADVLEKTYAHSPKRHLVRAVGGEARGFLSDHYRRLDSRPIFDAFVESAMDVGAVPYSATASDVRCALKMIVPKVQVLPLSWKDAHGTHSQNEYLALGLEISNSDFGAGGLALRLFINRLWCLNGATAEDVMRMIHLGGRLNDDIVWSEKTLRLDTEATTSSVRDYVKGALAPAKLDAFLGRIARAQDEAVKWDGLKARLAKSLTKDELRRVGESFEGPDVQNLPPGNTMWRASNAVSWVLQQVESSTRRMELERLAGNLIDGKVVADIAA